MNLDTYEQSQSYSKGPSAEILDRSVGDAFRTAAALWPSRVAITDGVLSNPESWTFSEVLACAEAIAGRLLRSFSPGDAIGIWAANSPQWVMVEAGAALAGLTLVTLNPAYLKSELIFALRQSRSRGVIYQAEFRGRDLERELRDALVDVPDLVRSISLADLTSDLEDSPSALLPEVDPLSVAQIQYTSGTTGTPKGACLTHRGLVNNGLIYASTVGATCDDVWVNPMPLFHTAGCGLVTLGSLQTGGRHVIPHQFDPELMLSLIEKERGTVTLSVPTMLTRMLDYPSVNVRDLSSWRLATIGGAPVAPELVKRAQLIGLEVAIGFGQTESSPYLTHTLPNDAHPTWERTVGRPLAETELKIVDPDTNVTLPIGSVGEICARGYSIMRGYFNLPEETDAAIDGNGWLHTGDLGSIDSYGYCSVEGRLKDMIIRGGENIYPSELEGVIYEHEGVREVAVIGVASADLGEVPVAFVVIGEGAIPDPIEFETFCRGRLASFKVPRSWHFVDRLPHTASGKIKKFELRRSYDAELE